MKKTVLILCLILSNISRATDTNESCLILSSPPDYSVMNLITVDAVWQVIPKLGGKDLKYVSFGDAYKTFFESTFEIIKKSCKDYKLDGAVNFRISHQTTKDMYYFSANFDYWKFINRK